MSQQRPLASRLVPRLVALVALAPLIAGGCGGGGAPSTSARTTFIIGEASSQTGILAYQDVAASRGLRMAVDEINAKGGIAGKWRVEIILEDDRSDPSQAAVVAQDLVSKGINFMVCTCDADPCVAAGGVAQRNGIPNISTQATAPTLPGAVGNFQFMGTWGDNTQATVLAEYAISKGYKTAYQLCSPDSAYTSKGCDYFKDVFEKMGGKVLGRGSYTLGAADFTAEVTKIKNMSPQPDVIMTPAYSPDAPTFFKQLRAAGVTIPVIGHDGLDSSDTITASGPSSEGVVFTTHGFPSPGSTTEAFYNAYKDKYGAWPDTIAAAIGHDIGTLIAAAATKANSTDPKMIRDAFDSLAGVQGLLGSYTYQGQHGIALLPVYLVVIKDGKFQLLDMKSPDPADIPAP